MRSIRDTFLFFLIQCFFYLYFCEYKVPRHYGLVVTHFNGNFRLEKPYKSDFKSYEYNFPKFSGMTSQAVQFSIAGPEVTRYESYFKSSQSGETYVFCPISEEKSTLLVQVVPIFPGKEINDSNFCLDDLDIVHAEVNNPWAGLTESFTNMRLIHFGFQVYTEYLTTRPQNYRSIYKSWNENYDLVLGIAAYIDEKLKKTVAVKYVLLSLPMDSWQEERFMENYKKLYPDALPVIDLDQDEQPSNAPRLIELGQEQNSPQVQPQTDQISKDEPSNLSPAISINPNESDNESIDDQELQEFEKYTPILVHTQKIYNTNDHRKMPVTTAFLAPNEHFQIPVWKYAALIQYNQVLIPTTIKSKWDEVALFSRIVAKHIGDLTVTAGISGLLSMKDDDDRPKYVTVGKGNRALSLPNYYWYAFESFIGGKWYGILVIMHSNPYGNEIHTICEDQCENHGWTISNQDFSTGLIYCCQMRKQHIDQLDAKYLALNERDIFNLKIWGNVLREIIEEFQTKKANLF